MNRFVFLNLPILSLGGHLGVTVSPRPPLPAGSVTLPVDSRSPPLGLMPPHSRAQGSLLSSFLIAFRAYAPRIWDEAHCRLCPRPRADWDHRSSGRGRDREKSDS